MHGAGGPSGANVKLVVGTTDVNTGEKSKASRVDGRRHGEHRHECERGHGHGLAADEREQLRRLDDPHRQGRAHGRARAARTRVAASKEGGIGPKSTLPESPSLLAPEDNLEIDFRKRDPLRLRWSPVKDATAYEVEIARSRLFVKDSILDIGASERSKAEVLIDISQIQPGSYFWHVRSAAQGESARPTRTGRRPAVSRSHPASSPRRGSTRCPPISSSRRGRTSSARPSCSSGARFPAHSVTVNGEIADVGGDGTFRKVISMGGDGLQTIVIKARTAGGETVKKESVLISSN